MGRLIVLAVVVAAACGSEAPTARITGRVFADDNANGVPDPGELGIAGVVVYANLDIDPTISGIDPATRTADDGSYELTVPGPGTYSVRQVLPFGLRERTPAAKPRIAPVIGGGDADTAEYGFMVGLGARFGGESVFQFCGGVLLTDRHVVTAAHCSVGLPADDVVVIAGTLDPTGEGGQLLDVQSITLHPTFFVTSAGYDIAVWTLAEPVDLEAAGLYTVELLTPETAALADPGALATAVGWGATERDTDLLQQVHVPIVAEAECAAAYPMATNLFTQVCAGVVEGGIDTCQGDSGGPLLARDRDRQVWALAGITSYGNGCALPNFPGVYARVSPLAEWATAQAIETSAPAEVTTIPP